MPPHLPVSEASPSLGDLTSPAIDNPSVTAHAALSAVQQRWQWTSARPETRPEFVDLGQRVELVCLKVGELVNASARLTPLQASRVDDLIVRLAGTHTQQTLEDPLLSTQVLLPIATYLNSCRD